MPTSKKKKGSNSNSNKNNKALQSHFQNVLAPKFRQMLQTARQEYAKGRSYDAVEMQREAIEFGSKHLPGFEDNSLVKAHALVDLGLALSAIMTDFARGDEWQQTKVQCEETFENALVIYEARLQNKTLTRWRKEECWIKGGDYHSPVPQTERMGPIDYASALHCSMTGKEPSTQTVERLKRFLAFARQFRAQQCAITLQAGMMLQGELAESQVSALSNTLKNHVDVLKGKITTEQAFENLDLNLDTSQGEARHAGHGKMKATHVKLAKDVDQKGLRLCENPNCQQAEKQPRQFATCSRCKWVAYCSRTCQKSDWKRHKLECSTSSTDKRQAYNEQNKLRSCLQYGQSQQLLDLVRFLHHYACISQEMATTRTPEAQAVVRMCTPKFDGAELGQVQLGIQDVTIMWNGIWSMDASKRKALITRFVQEMHTKYGNSLDFNVVKDWNKYGVHGVFGICKHTSQGSVLICTDWETYESKAYLVVGITQSLESLLQDAPLPVFVNTAILPFKGLMLSQGTMVPCMDPPPALALLANGFAKGQVEMEVLTTLI